MLPTRRAVSVLFLCAAIVVAWCASRLLLTPYSEPTSAASAAPLAEPLDQLLASRVQPFLQRFCIGCHGDKKHEGGLNLRRDATLASIASNDRQWEYVLERLQTQEMPPEDAPRQPSRDERAGVIAALQQLRDELAQKHAGDPGIVLARRLSNAEFDYTIRDLTGVDIRPTREFPVDPANEAGFDNSGESLAMSGPLFKKYLAAARLVADHVVLKPEGFVFAPHPAVTDTDRDKYCVARIMDFYRRHEVDLAEYFLAAWKYHHRAALGRGDTELQTIAADQRLSPSYLSLIWSVLNDGDANAGPLAVVRKVWQGLPNPPRTEPARAGCERLRDLVLRLRNTLQPNVAKLHVKGISEGSQPFVLWRNRQLAERHRRYTGDVAADLPKLAEQLNESDQELAKMLAADAAAAPRLREQLEQFCSAFPDAFVVSDRGPYFDSKKSLKGRPLTAGFHLMHGHFRDDRPLYDLVLDERERRELDSLWDELNFITLAPIRQYKDFIFFERAEPPRFMYDAEFDFARSEDKDAASAEKMARLAQLHLARARKIGAGDEALGAIETYYASISAEIRRVEQMRLAAEPSHLQALAAFAERAYRRPLTADERDTVLGFYHKLRREDLGHEEAMRDAIASVLLSPQFCYRLDFAQMGPTVQALSDYELASRLSYFLWSSMPDAELMSHAAAGDLRRPEVLTGQARRMLRDPKVRGLATEFAGNWLDFRRFEEHNAVDRERFPEFTNDLRRAMFEEPIRYFMDIAHRNRLILDLLYGKDTFVNATLAKHYGIPGEPGASATGASQDPWFHVPDADRYGRGGLLPMAVFLTKNAPGLRTSPVKRGYWVVRRLLGERIPPPPPTVPELPADEAKLGELTLPQLLARHREDKNCAGCHRRFDSVGIIFEGFGPIGERRTKDLGGRAVQTAAAFPDGTDRDGLAGLRAYLHEKREAEFVDNLSRKLFAYALGRSLVLTDRQAIESMRSRLAVEGYAFEALIGSIVVSPQFLTKRVHKGPPLP